MGCHYSKESLSKNEMDFLRGHTKYDDDTIKKWHKNFRQDCPTGKLTPVQFVQMYKTFFPIKNPEQFCHHVFRVTDTDGNGYIDFKEFLLSVNVVCDGTAEEKLKWAFRIYDVDGNGVIQQEEMTKMAESVYGVLSAADKKPNDMAEEGAKNTFVRFDLNSDGYITEEEFIKGCLQDNTLTKLLL